MTTLDTLIFNLVVQNSIRVLEYVLHFFVVFVYFFLYMLVLVTFDVALLHLQGKKKNLKLYMNLSSSNLFLILFFPQADFLP